MKLTLAELNELSGKTDKISKSKYNYTNLLLLLNEEINNFLEARKVKEFEIEIFKEFIDFLNETGKLKGVLLHPPKEDQISYRISGLLQEIFGGDKKVKRKTLTRCKERSYRYSYWETKTKKAINNDLVYLFSNDSLFAENSGLYKYGVGITISHNNIFTENNSITVSVSKTLTGNDDGDKKKVRYSSNMKFKDLQKFLRDVNKLNKCSKGVIPIESFMTIFYEQEGSEWSVNSEKVEVGVFKDEVISELSKYENSLNKTLYTVKNEITEKENTPEVQMIEEEIQRLKSELNKKKQEAKSLTVNERQKESEIYDQLKNVKLAREEIKGWSGEIEFKFKNDVDGKKKLNEIYGLNI